MTEPRCNYARGYFVFLLGKLKTCIILSFIFSIFGFPIIPSSSIVGNETLNILAFVSIAGNFMISFVAPLTARGYLFSKASADNILSLPLTSFQRYVCEAGASLLSFTVPCVLAMPLTFINHIYHYSDIFRTSVIFFMVMLMFASLNIFLSGFCGRLAEAILYPAAINVVLPLFTTLAVMLANSSILGALSYANSFSNSLGVSGMTSPIGCFLYYAFLRYERWWEIFITAPIYSAVFLTLGYLVFRRRPAENIGKPFVYRKAYAVNSELIAVGCVVSYISILAVFTHSRTAELFVIAAAVLAVLLLILLLVMEFINYKRVNSVPKFLLKYTGTLAAGVLISFGLYASEGFGETWHIPTADETEYLESYAFISDGSIRHVVSVDTLGGGGLFELLRSEHERIVAEHNDIPDDKTNFHLRYRLKNGTLLSREYCVPLSDDFLQRTVETEGYKFSGLTSMMMDHGMVRGITDDGVTYAIGTPEHFKPSFVFSNFFTGKGNMIRVDIDMDDLTAALTEDLKNDGSFGRHSEAPAGVLTIGYLFDDDESGNGYSSGTRTWANRTAEYLIYDSYVNTTAFLRKYGVVPTAAEAVAEAASEGVIFSVERYPMNGCSQTTAMPDYYGCLDMGTAQAVFIEPEEFLETASKVDHVSGSNEYVYFMCAGVPGFFDMDNIFGVDDSMLPQLEESGLIGEKFFYDERGIPVYKKGNTRAWLVSEQYYPLLERYFDEKYVFSYKN